MRSCHAKARRALLQAAQQMLDGPIGQEVLAHFMGKELHDLQFRRMAVYAHTKMVERGGNPIAEKLLQEKVFVKVEPAPNNPKLVQLVAVLRDKK